jgi:hypothetical protein
MVLFDVKWQKSHVWKTSNYPACSHFEQKRSLFRHPTPLFSADALHRLQKGGLSDEKSPTFLLQNRWAV